MANIISRLKLESGEFDSKIKRASQELLAYSEHCKKMGLEMGYANRDAKEFAKALGSMQTVSQTARGKINELSEAFINAKVMYKNMTDAEKQGQFGKNLAASLDQLKARLNDAKKDLSDVQKEMSGGNSKFGQFGSVIDTLGQKMGLTTNATELLTSKTALMTAGIGASIAIIGKATDAWAKYNSELSKQDQVTQVTTGLRGPSANRMTDTARAVVDTYNVDFREVINAANTLMTQFGKSGDEAMQLIKDGMQGMIQGDGPKLLQMIQQYAPSFRDAGIEASQLVAIIHNSEGGIFTDQNMNAIVMGIKNIRLMTKATSDALAKMGIDGQEMTRKLNDGSMTIFQAMQQVTDAIQKAGTGSQAVGEVMQQVFGRQGAAAGTNLGKAIATLNTNLEETKRQTGELGDAFADLQTANEKLNTAIREAFGYDGWEQMAKGIESKLIKALATVIEQLGKIRKWFHDFTPEGQTENIQTAEQKDMNRRLTYVRSGSNKEYWNQQNRQYYDQQVSDRQFKVSALRGDDTITKGLRQKAEADLQAWKNLRDEYNKKANDILSAPPKKTPQAGTTNPVTPTVTTSGSGSGKTKTEQTDKEAEQTAKMLAELRRAEAKATKEIADARAREHQTETRGLSGFNEQTIAAWTSMMKDQLGKADFGSVVYQSIEENMRDMTTIVDLTKEALKHGLDPQSLGLEELYEQAFDNIDISDEALSNIVKKINAAIKNGTKLEINEETGKVDEKKEEKDKRDTLESSKKMVGGLSQVASGLQQMGVELPKEVQNLIGVLQGAMSVMEGVNTIITATQTPALTANTLALGALTAAVNLNTATGLLPGFFNGGTVRAAEGFSGTVRAAEGFSGIVRAAEGFSGIVPGTQFSGDNIPILANAGEVVLNKAQTAALASDIQSGGSRSVNVRGVLRGTDILLVADRTGQAEGRGELLFFKG